MKNKFDALLLSGLAQLGATFITDGTRLRDWIGAAPLLTDSLPKRLASRETDTRPDFPLGEVPEARRLASLLTAEAGTDQAPVKDCLLWVFGVFGQTVDFPPAAGAAS